jgi:hypothetical protein
MSALSALQMRVGLGVGCPGEGTIANIVGNVGDSCTIDMLGLQLGLCKYSGGLLALGWGGNTVRVYCIHCTDRRVQDPPVESGTFSADRVRNSFSEYGFGLWSRTGSNFLA